MFYFNDYYYTSARQKYNVNVFRIGFFFPGDPAFAYQIDLLLSDIRVNDCNYICAPPIHLCIGQLGNHTVFFCKRNFCSPHSPQETRILRKFSVPTIIMSAHCFQFIIASFPLLISIDVIICLHRILLFFASFNQKQTHKHTLITSFSQSVCQSVSQSLTFKFYLFI